MKITNKKEIFITIDNLCKWISQELKIDIEKQNIEMWSISKSPRK